MKFFFAFFAVICTTLGAHAAPQNITMQTIDLKPFHDSQTVLNNPHKGWYHHYFDNGIDNYLPANDAELENFPGLNHLYLRLAWSFLEPKKGEFHWEIIDDVIDKWTKKGLTISFRITSKETGLKFATPQWVVDAGAQGAMVEAWGDTTWNPDYGDPIFLKHLEAFHRAFAARYDGKPWVEYIDIGSYGQWGEGHNYMAGNKAAPLEVVKAHIDLYKRVYQKSLLVVSDDVVGDRDKASGAEMAEYLTQNAISIRDDSVLVKHYVQNYAPTFSLQSPQLFARAAPTLPTILELQHYGMMKDPKRDGTWAGIEGSERGAAMFEGAIKLSQATWIGYHGYANEWLQDNPNLTNRLANLCGYWFFPNQIKLAQSVRRGTKSALQIEWFNRGVAPAYHRYNLKMRLRAAQNRVVFEQNLSEADPRNWKPQTPVSESYAFTLPKALAPGEYALEIGLFSPSQFPQRDPAPRPVWLGLRENCKSADGFYHFSKLKVR